MKWALYILTGAAAICGVMAITAASRADASRSAEGSPGAARTQSARAN